MSDLEKALDGTQPFGMSFIKSNCTAISVNLYKIIKHLDELAPGKYGELYSRFKTIRDAIEPESCPKKAPQRGQTCTAVPLH